MRLAQKLYDNLIASGVSPDLPVSLEEAIDKSEKSWQEMLERTDQDFLKNEKTLESAFLDGHLDKLLYDADEILYTCRRDEERGRRNYAVKYGDFEEILFFLIKTAHERGNGIHIHDERPYVFTTNVANIRWEEITSFERKELATYYYTAVDFELIEEVNSVIIK